MLDRSWKQLMICLTANPGNDRAAVTAARDIPLSSPAPKVHQTCHPLTEIGTSLEKARQTTEGGNVRDSMEKGLICSFLSWCLG